MARIKRVLTSALSLALVLGMFTIGQALAVSPAEDARSKSEPFNPVTFLKSFKIGMSYAEVQSALPKHAEQDMPAYLESEQAFLLGVDFPGGSAWSASFKFDTLDTPARRPEQLIEISCSSDLSTRSESFENIVRKVTAEFGDPIEVDRSQERFQQAGWRVTGGSVLTVEYSKNAGAGRETVNIEFVIRKTAKKKSASDNAVA